MKARNYVYAIIILLLATYSRNILLPQKIEINNISICTRVIDGDTFDIYTGARIRLADIDTPEYDEYGYESAADTLSSWILGKKVYLDVDSKYVTDNYGRYVCVVYVASGTGYMNVNKALLNSGHAEIWQHDNDFNPNNWHLNQKTLVLDQAYDDSSSYDSSYSSSSGSSSGSTSSSSTYYVGSQNSNIYHYTSCYWADQISSYNLRTWSTTSQARADGYRACKVCNPP